MRIFLNEIERDASAGATLFALRDELRPGADLIIVNGYPAAADREVAEGDRIVMIRRGEIPSADELEALMAARHTPGVHARLKRSTVGIAGCGGLGSAVAVALARIGVGRLILADFDIVEPSNLNRQQFFVDQIGLPKVDALKANLARINPYVKVAAFYGRLERDNIPQIFSMVDVLVEAFDVAEQKAMLVESFRAACPERPLIAASGLAGHAASNTVVTRRAGRNFYLVGDGSEVGLEGVHRHPGS